MFPEWITVLARDHQSDVLRLNDSLKLRGDSLLDPEVPPHTFVGDIKGMKTNDCVLLLGINPKRNHDDGRLKASGFRTEIQSKQCPRADASESPGNFGGLRYQYRISPQIYKSNS